MAVGSMVEVRIVWGSPLCDRRHRIDFRIMPRVYQASEPERSVLAIGIHWPAD